MAALVLLAAAGVVSFARGSKAANLNLVANPSAETASAGLPVGWSTSGPASTKLSFQYLDTGHTGSHSLQVVVKKKAGKQEWMFASVPVAAKATYTFSDWYESDTTTQLSVVVTQSNGKASTIVTDDEPPAAGWTPATLAFTTPKNAVSVTVYQLISSVGQVTTDDYDLERTAGAMPTVTLTAPADGAALAGTVQLTAKADGGGSPVAGVEYLVDGDEIGAGATKAPYAASWDTTGIDDGTHQLIAVATNQEGVAASSDPITVSTRNACTVYEPESCEQAGGTFIVFHDVTQQQGQSGFVFQCSGPLSSYRDSRATVTGSGWPVHLTLDYTRGRLRLRRGCAGQRGDDRRSQRRVARRRLHGRRQPDDHRPGRAHRR